MNTDNKQPDSTDNGQPLTAGELAALKRVDTFENIDYEMWETLKSKGLIVVGRRQIDVTEKGKRALASAQAQTASEPKPTTVAPVRGIDPKARQNVIEIICDNLTDLFNDWLSDNLVEDLLTEYDNGFLVTQLTSDISEGISSWAAKIQNSKPLADMVYDFCEEYLESEDE